VTADIVSLTDLRAKLAALRNGTLERLCKELDAGALDLLTTVQVGILAIDERLDDLRAEKVAAAGDPGRQ